MKQKGLAPIVILLIIGVAIIGGSLVYKKQVLDRDLAPNYGFPPYESPQPMPALKPTPQDPKFTEIDTTSWKEYTNFSGIYSFKYPPDWFISETSIVDKYHARGNAIFQNKSFEEISESAWIPKFSPPVDLVFGEVEIDSVYRSTARYASEANFYNIERGHYWYWSLYPDDSNYVFKPEELKLGNYRVMVQKTFPVARIDNKDPDLIRHDYWIWIRDKNEDESELFHLVVYSSFKNKNRDIEINKLHNMFSALKINKLKL